MLTSKQRAYLRAMANGYDTIFQIGKGGVSENMTEQIGNALEARELIKLRTLDTCEYGPREAAELLATALSAEVVSVTGSRFVLYRESRKHKKIRGTVLLSHGFFDRRISPGFPDVPGGSSGR